MNEYVIYHADNFGTAGDGFTKVAVVSANSLGEAYRLTNNVEEFQKFAPRPLRFWGKQLPTQ